MTGVSTQFLGSHRTEEARAVEPLWCNCRGTREEQKECHALYGVPTQLHGSPCFSMMQDIPVGRGIKAGETPDKLIEQILGLADRCNFPTDVEKERHIQFQMVHALIRKLLVMKIEATTAEMLAVCRTHIAITDNMSSMGLSTKAISAVQKTIKKVSSHSNPCGNCTKCHTQGESTAQQRTLPAILARRSVTRSRNPGSLTRPRMPARHPGHNLGGDMGEGGGQMG